MIKQTITYTDFNDVTHTEDFWFHLDKADLLEMQAMRSGGMKAYMEDLIKSDDKLEILRIFRMFILKSVGKRSEDGRRFHRTDDIRAEFEETNAYQEFLFYLANNADEAAKFLEGLMPADLVAQVKAAEAMGTVELPADTSTNDAEVVEQPEVVKQWTDYTEQELMELPNVEFQALIHRSKNGGSNVPRMLLLIQSRRSKLGR